MLLLDLYIAIFWLRIEIYIELVRLLPLSEVPPAKPVIYKCNFTCEINVKIECAKSVYVIKLLRHFHV